MNVVMVVIKIIADHKEMKTDEIEMKTDKSLY